MMPAKKHSTSWDGLSYRIQPWIREAVISSGFANMTPVQASTIPLLSQHKDVVVEAVTGSGKTLAFVIPVLEKICKVMFEEKESFKKGHFGALIVSPTRELASQINSVIENLLQHYPEDKARISTQLLVGSVGSAREDIQEFLKHRPQILIGTPGRLLEFLSAPVVKTSSCEILILDEADKLLDVSFLNDTQSIVRHLPRQKRTGLFSATISSAGTNIFKTGLSNPVKVTVRSENTKMSSVPESLGLFYMVVKQDLKLKLLFNLLVNYRYRKVIVYFPTCAGVTHFYSIFNYLLKANNGPENDFKLFSLHGKLNAKPRLRTLESFSRSESSKSILFTTDVAARGLDIPEVDLVLQIDAPTDPDMFPHRCGRTGRANKVGKAITMLSEGREEDYVEFMEVRGLQLKNLDTPALDDKFSKWYDDSVNEWLLQDRTRYDNAVKSYVGFIRYYSMHSATSIFRLQSLDYRLLCGMYSLARIPKMPENRYMKDFPEDGWLNHSIDFDKYAYKDKHKEETRLHELKTEQKKKERHEKALKKRELAKTNSAWSSKTETKEQKAERREKLKRRREVVEAKIKENQENEESSDSDAEVDWKDLVNASKRKKTDSAPSNGFFDDL